MTKCGLFLPTNQSLHPHHMRNEPRNLFLAREHQHHLQMRIRYQGREQIREQGTGGRVQTNERIVQNQHIGSVHQCLDQLELTQLATRKQHDVLVQKRLHSKQRKEPFFPSLVLRLGQEFAHQGGGLHVLRVPTLLIVIASVGIAV